MNLLNNELLEDYIENFYGYGNLNGDYWFVGMEEGGGDEFKEIESKLNQWKLSKNENLLDLYEFHRGIINSKNQNQNIYFKGKNSKYQRTWGGLIKVLLSCENKEPNINNIKLFQSNNLGRSDSNNCITEVFPLPSPSVNKFHYCDWSNLPYLKDRLKYKNHIRDKRIEKLHQLIVQHEPKYVIFYSTSPEYIKYWSKISGIDFNSLPKVMIHNKDNSTKLYSKFIKKGNTVFCIMHHPTYRAVGNKYLTEVGKKLKMF